MVPPGGLSRKRFKGIHYPSVILIIHLEPHDVQVIVHTTMAQNNSIINHYSLFAFCQKFGSKVAVGTCTNSKSGEEFPACSFTDRMGKRTLVHFGKSLEGGLSLKEIAQMKDDLQVVELEVSPETLAARKERARATGKAVQMENYALCKAGQGGWESVDLEW
jgi:hypothetical protein